MNSDLKITTEQKQARVLVIVFHIGGWLDAQSEPQLLEAARLAYVEGARYLMIDMSDLDTLTSARMRAQAPQAWTRKRSKPILQSCINSTGKSVLNAHS